MENLDPILVAPIRLVVTNDPKPQIRLGPEGADLDILPAVERMLIEVQGSGVYVSLQMRVDLEFAFPVNRVDVEGAGLVDGLTVEELDRVAASAGMSSTIGAALLEHLRRRSGVRAQ